MNRHMIAGFGLVILAVASCSSDRTVDRTSRALPAISAPQHDRPGLLSRLNPFSNASVRSNPSRAVTSPRASGRLCGIRGLEGEEMPTITSAVAGCGVEAPVRVTSVDGVKLSQGALMDCQTAAALHQWVRTGVKPAVGRSGGGVTGLRVAAHYVCRARNHRPGARMSEHGRGRAIDISAIQLADGSEMSVLRDWRDSPHSKALQNMHRAACGTFGTTLGPGSDGMHEDHFHFDTARHRNGPHCR